MLKKLTLAAAVCALSGGAVEAQHAAAQTTTAQPSRNHWCGHDKLYHETVAMYPEIKEREARLEAEINRAISRMNLNQYFKTNGLAEDNEVLRVPIVFHIIHSNYGSDYIPDADVYRYVREINDVFNRRNADTSVVIPLYRGNVPGTNTRYIAKSNIEFHLAQRDPNGQPTNGITRRRHYLSNGGDNNAKFDVWAPDSYMNVWIVNDFSAGNTAGAFAIKPANAASIPYYDGPIAALARLGGNANSDYTLAHEIGHSLNLSHTFGDANQTNPPVCGDDNVDDTPPTNGGSNGGGSGGCGDLVNIYDTACVYNNVFLGRPSPDVSDTFPDRVANRGITFHTRSRVRLRSVKIYPHDTAGAPFIINLRRNGTLVQSYSGTVDSGFGRMQTVPVNFLLPADSSYTISFGTNPNARRDSMATPLPNTQARVPGALFITNSTTDGLYNYFYNWDVQYGYFKIYDSATVINLYDFDSTMLATRKVDGGYIIDYPDTVNAQNVMDYQFCSKMFTNGQALRMRATLRSNIAGRSELIDSANQVRTGIRIGNDFPARADVSPVADFSINSVLGSASILSEKVYICPGNSVTFVNRSWRDTTASAAWTFSGGGPTSPTSTSTLNVTNTFNTPGGVDVTLTVQGNNGTGSSTITKQRAVYVADLAAKINDPLSVWTEFNPATEQLQHYPIFNYYNNEYNWSISNTGVFDGYSMRYYSYDNRTTQPALSIGSPQGDYDDFFMPPVNLANFGGNDTLNLTFNYSSATRSAQPSDMNDIFEIAYSANCGTTWTTMKTMTKNELHNVGTVASYGFMPGSGYASSEWAYAAVRVPNPARVDNALFRFRYRPGAVRNGYVGSGNNFYIDRIHFSAFPAGINETQVAQTGFSLVPNPTRGGATVSIKGNIGNAVMTVTDVTGKMVYTSSNPKATSAYTSFEIPAQAVSAKGIYFVRVGQGASSHTEKLVVY